MIAYEYLGVAVPEEFDSIAERRRRAMAFKVELDRIGAKTGWAKRGKVDAAGLGVDALGSRSAFDAALRGSEPRGSTLAGLARYAEESPIHLFKAMNWVTHEEVLYYLRDWQSSAPEVDDSETVMVAALESARQEADLSDEDAEEVLRVARQVARALGRARHGVAPQPTEGPLPMPRIADQGR